MPYEPIASDNPPESMGFEDTLSQYIKRIEDAEANADPNHGVVTFRDLKIPALTRGRIERRQIGWRLYQHLMYYLIKVEAGTRVEKHSHNEDVFRLVTRGSLILRTNPDEMEFHEGEWFVVREGTDYEIETRTGYTALAGYKMACKAQN
jgi:quercetin dioxygenase-like cupin family protein